MRRLETWLPTKVGISPGKDGAFKLLLRLDAYEGGGKEKESIEYVVTVDDAITLAWDIMQAAEVEDKEVLRRLNHARSMKGLGPVSNEPSQ